jgi:hypothetical protein
MSAGLCSGYTTVRPWLDLKASGDEIHAGGQIDLPALLGGLVNGGLNGGGVVGDTVGFRVDDELGHGRASLGEGGCRGA